jgi:hypothetical protein
VHFRGAKAKGTRVRPLIEPVHLITDLLPRKREQMKQLMKIAEERLDAQITQAKKESPHYTPLTFVHQHTTLSDAQKDTYKTVLAHASAAKKPLPSQLEDVRTLLENEDLSSLDGSEGTSSESSEGSPYATTQELPNRRAPIGIMAEMSFAHQDGPSYFQSGKHTTISFRTFRLTYHQDP